MQHKSPLIDGRSLSINFGSRLRPVKVTCRAAPLQTGLCTGSRRRRNGVIAGGNTLSGKPSTHFGGCVPFNGLVGFINPNKISVEERREQVVVHVRDPDAVTADDDEDNPDKYPPNAFWRVIAALMYMIPWIDSVGLGREIYHRFPSFIYLYFLTGPFVGFYYFNQFASLLIFFLMFLAIVKNNKLSHFVRFNCMQAIMLDIVVMLFTILHSYFPAELKWSWILSVFDQYSWVASMGTVLYCVYFALLGKYPDLPYVSEAVYIQVEMSDYA